MAYIPTIGLEIHIELKTKSKMFCSCLNDSDQKLPNINICPVCTAQPGSLPVINEEALNKVIKTGLALNSKILEHSKFDRKNYFYPDLPKGYQISQYDMPLCQGGFLIIDTRKVKITRVHLEEDTGKLIHEKDFSLVDFNRAGIPLMELVTEPDIFSAKEARRFAEELQLILRYLDVSEANMEKGQMRIEANISVSQAKKLGTKVEIKNLNSFRSVERGIDYEVKRQAEVLEAGKKVIQETRGWHDSKEITFSQRKKEEAHDYRYFPEPDLPPLHFTGEFIEKIKAQIPELPQQRRERFIEQYHLNEKNAEIFTVDKAFGDFYEKMINELENWVKEIKTKRSLSQQEKIRLIDTATQYVINDLRGSTYICGVPVDDKDFPITPENYAELIILIYEKKISSKIAKELIEEMMKTGADPSDIIQEKGLVQITDEKEIETIVKAVIAKNQKAVKDYKEGKAASLQFLIGQVMAQTRGKASPETVGKILKKLLS